MILDCSKILFSVIFSAWLFSGQALEINIAEIPVSHPRLLVSKEDFLRIKKNAETPDGKLLAGRILHDADLVLKHPPLRYEMTGKRLLPVSRGALHRIISLTMAYQLNGNRKYADRAIHEMLNAAGFPDWNPPHFLDTAEMTLALSLGYDWLYDLLSPEEQKTIAAAIASKGLKPSFEKEHWWLNTSNNWNPVCHAGMVAGAIAVSESEPKLAAMAIKRAVEKLPRYMKAGYSPNGAYAEGTGYWNYGTDFTALLLGMLNHAFGHDFGLSSSKGFSTTGDFIFAATGPTGMMFNYADNSPGRSVSFAMFWLAAEFNRPDWFEAECQVLKSYSEDRPGITFRSGRDRLAALAMLYLTTQAVADAPESPLAYYSGDGSPVPVAMLRSDHTRNASWIGIKGGAPSAPHGHMDGGSFVFESGNYRWIVDLGMEDYTKLEAAKVGLWSMKQDSERWAVFRIGPDSHNILRIGNARQFVSAKGEIIEFSDRSVLMDLTALYPDAKKVHRRFSLPPEPGMAISDKLEGLKPGTEVSWQICTRADTAPQADGTLLLKHDKQTLAIRKNIPIKWEIIPEEKLRKAYDSSNPDAKMIRFSATAPENGKIEFEVTFFHQKSH